jgi:hypothetical protein
MNERRLTHDRAQAAPSEGGQGVGTLGSQPAPHRALEAVRAWPCGSVVEGPGLPSVNPTSAHRMQEASLWPWPIGWATVTWAMMSLTAS